MRENQEREAVALDGNQNLSLNGDKGSDVRRITALRRENLILVETIERLRREIEALKQRFHQTDDGPR